MKFRRSFVLASMAVAISIAALAARSSFASNSPSAPNQNPTVLAPTFDELITDRRVVLDALKGRNADLTPSSMTVDSALEGTEVLLTESEPPAAVSPEESAADSIELFKQMHAVDLTRYFARRYGLDPQDPMPEPLYDYYQSYLDGNVAIDDYINQLNTWMNEKPLWLN